MPLISLRSLRAIISLHNVREASQQIEFGINLFYCDFVTLAFPYPKVIDTLNNFVDLTSCVIRQIKTRSYSYQ